MEYLDPLTGEPLVLYFMIVSNVVIGPFDLTLIFSHFFKTMKILTVKLNSLIEFGNKDIYLEPFYVSLIWDRHFRIPDFLGIWIKTLNYGKKFLFCDRWSLSCLHMGTNFI